MSMSTSDYLTFAIAGQDYGAAILAVREIRGWTAETPLPNAPAGVRGIINLRGQVVPIFDLRVRLGAAATPPTATHVVIVVEAAAGQFGLLVDSVSDILTPDDAELQPVPPAATDGNGLLLALAARPEPMVPLLDIHPPRRGAQTPH